MDKVTYLYDSGMLQRKRVLPWVIAKKRPSQTKNTKQDEQKICEPGSNNKSNHIRANVNTNIVLVLLLLLFFYVSPFQFIRNVSQIA